ncbi:MAG: hypothetical protein M3440_04170 [Chloroflexota bacterium]|nr:hypothetical protein [Chloroflexota bacterium]
MAIQTSQTCPLSQQHLIDDFFMEHRTKILDIAAFLDRLDRSIDQNGNDDFRIVAFREAVRELSSNDPERGERVQMIFSDKDTQLLDELDRKAAYGASVRQKGDNS